MDKKLTLIKELPDGSTKILCDISEFSYTATRMGDAPKISATVNSFTADMIDNSCYVVFNGDKYYVNSTPDTTKSNDDARYKYNVTFHSPRLMLNNILFFDVAITENQLASKSSAFKLSGTIVALVEKLNLSLKYAKIDEKFEVVIDDPSKYAEDTAKTIDFNNNTVNEAIQQIFKTFEEEYYILRVGEKEVFHVGPQDSANIDTVLEYGADKSLLQITRRNKNSKVINRITGVGSSENIPYFYPNESPTGEHIVVRNTVSDGGISINYELLSAKVDLGGGCTLSYWEKLKGVDKIKLYFKHEGSNSVSDSVSDSGSYYTLERLAQSVYQTFGLADSDGYRYSDTFMIELGDKANGVYMCKIKPSVAASYTSSVRRSSYGSTYAQSRSMTRMSDNVITMRDNESRSVVDLAYPSTRTVDGGGGGGGGSRPTDYSRPTSTTTGSSNDIDDAEIFVEGVFASKEATEIVDYTIQDDGSICFDSRVGSVVRFKVRSKSIPEGYNKLTMDVSFVDNSADFTHYDVFIVDGSNTVIDARSCGISLIGNKTVGGVIEISATSMTIPHQNKLMPSIYRGTYGHERFYDAVNGDKTVAGLKVPSLGDSEDNRYSYTYSFQGHEFDNPFEESNRCEHIVEFDNIKPTIRGVTFNGLPIDVFDEFDYDLNDNDEIDDTNNLKHPFFYAKLRPLGFNLFESANEHGNMTFSFTNGDCSACVFEVVVDKDTNRNPILTKVVNGKTVIDKDANGIAKIATSVDAIQDSQNDTTNNGVWIALRKDNKTFNETFPNSKNGALPSTEDNFVITNINLPFEYIRAAEERLDEEIKNYLIKNNVEHFGYDIKFSRIFLSEHVDDILRKLNENSSIYVKMYDNDAPQLLYANSYTYTMREGEYLPEVSISLDDNVSLSASPKQSMISSITSEVMSNVARMNVLAQGAKYFLRKDQSDQTEHNITANELVVRKDSKVGGSEYVKGGLQVDKNAIVKQNLYVDKYSLFGDTAQFARDVVFGTFTDVAGSVTGAKVSPQGHASFNSIRANYFDVYTLRYNEIRGSSAFTYFDDTATILQVDPILDANNQEYNPKRFTLHLDGDETYLHPFKEYDILYGYVNNIGESGESAVGGQCWMHLLDMRDGRHTIDVEMYEDKDCPAGTNIEPTENMTFAHRGNCAPTIIAEQKDLLGRRNTFFISAKDGHIVQLLDVTAPKLFTLTAEDNPNNYSNYGVVMGKLPPDLLAYVNKYHSFVTKDDPILYAKYVAVQNFLQLDYAGRPIKTERYRGEWSAEQAQSEDKYRSETATDVTYYDTVTYMGSKWQCVKDKTEEPPSDDKSDWANIVRRGEDGEAGSQARTNLIKNSNFDIVIEGGGDSSIFSTNYGDKWLTFTRKANSSHYALMKYFNNTWNARYEPISGVTDGMYWCFVGTQDSFKIYNKATGKSSALRANNASGQMVVMSDVNSASYWSLSNNNNETISILYHANKTLGINSYSGLSDGGELRLYAAPNDTGSQWNIKDVIYAKYYPYWSNNNGSVIISAWEGYNAHSLSTHNNGLNISQGIEGIKPNQKHTMSFLYNTPNSDSNSFGWLSTYKFDEDKIISDSASFVDSLFGQRTVFFNGTNGEWKKAEITFWHDDVDEISIDILFYTAREGALVSQIKLEVGDDATPYRKAESDFYAPLTSLVFKRGESWPLAPIGGSYNNPIPEGWSDGIPDGTRAIYSSGCKFYAGGYSTGWSEPQLLSDTPDFEVIYSPTNFTSVDAARVSIPEGFSKNGVDIDEEWLTQANAAGWYDDDYYVDNNGNSVRFEALWMATNNRGLGYEWSDEGWVVSQVKGEKGNDGKDGKDGKAPNENLLNKTSQFDAEWTLGTAGIHSATIKDGLDGHKALYIVGVSKAKPVATQNVSLTGGEWYTLSFIAKHDGKATSRLGKVIGDGIIDTSEDVYVNGVASYVEGLSGVEYTSEWEKYSFTFKTLTTLPSVQTVSLYIKSRTDTAMYLCQPKLERGKDATPWCTSESDRRGTTGPAGERGALLSPQGNYDPKVFYTLNRNDDGSVFSIPCVYLPAEKGNGSYLTLKKDMEYSTTIDGVLYPYNPNTLQPIGPDDSEYWTITPYQEQVFTKFLMANYAKFGSEKGAVFFDRFLFSQYGVDRNGRFGHYLDYKGVLCDEDGSLSGEFTPSLAIDMYSGYIKANKIAETFAEYQYDYLPDGSSSYVTLYANEIDFNQTYNVKYNQRYADVCLLTMPLADDINTEPPFIAQADTAIDGLKSIVINRANMNWERSYRATVYEEGLASGFTPFASIVDAAKSSLLLCATPKLFHPYTWYVDGGVIYNDELSSPTGDIASGYFVVDGIVTNFLLIEPGMKAVLRSCRDTSDGKLYWYVENGSDFASMPYTVYVKMPKVYDSESASLINVPTNISKWSNVGYESSGAGAIQRRCFVSKSLYEVYEKLGGSMNIDVVSAGYDVDTLDDWSWEKCITSVSINSEHDDY